MSPFQIGVLSEALDQAYRVTGREELREWMVAMAAFVDEHGLDPVYDYTASSFGIVGGATWHSYGATEPVEFWDPVYTTSLVNVLVRGGVAQVPALVVLGMWIVVQLISQVGAIAETSQGGGVAYMAHIGGFVAGLVLVKLFATRQVAATA